ncbi:hypothetical protein, partial [Escherichia coli]
QDDAADKAAKAAVA